LNCSRASSMIAEARKVGEVGKVGTAYTLNLWDPAPHLRVTNGGYHRDPDHE